MLRKTTIVSLLVLISFVECGIQYNLFSINEKWVCGVKSSCLDCLQLPHCSWCASENKCFSSKISLFDGFCQNDTVLSQDFGLSLRKNAACACSSSGLASNCRADPDDAADCSGRGTCQCGRCVCDAVPHSDHVNIKTISGEYCEFDNFSCDGPDCKDGPYRWNPEDEDD
ncbi:integrin beta-6 [Plutella xylostella]|uniref:integrin beta-6 n=1 Tax=Plutella xylostella TaxID=51655 RepID=UPI002032FD70|nr:integrin beta-6 [Plutella xylostella]